MKNSNDTIGNRSRDLPVCSAVPQSLRHQRAPCILIVYTTYNYPTMQRMQQCTVYILYFTAELLHMS
jgi:hypothetical protein